MEPIKPHTKDHSVCGSHSLERLDHLATQFVEVIANSDPDMTDTPEDWEHAEDDEPI